MNQTASLPGTQTYTQGETTIDLELQIDQELKQQMVSIAEFIPRLTDFIATVERDRQQYNINPYTEKFDRGIHILGKRDTELGIFPDSNLVLKCSEGRWGAENPRKQFFRSVELGWEFRHRLSDQERALLQICPVYLHLQTHARNALFKRVLVMPKIEGTPLGKIETGFTSEFCQLFNIPDIRQIRRKSRFVLHRLLDRDRKRQLLKIQTAYLFQRLSQRGIKIFSLNQKNILAVNIGGNQTRYVIIDPIADYWMPITPAYNLLTAFFCR